MKMGGPSGRGTAASIVQMNYQAHLAATAAAAVREQLQPLDRAGSEMSEWCDVVRLGRRLAFDHAKHAGANTGW